MNYLVDLNLKAAFNVAQLVVKKMLKNKKRPGSIVNMSSQLGHVGMSGRNVGESRRRTVPRMAYAAISTPNSA